MRSLARKFGHFREKTIVEDESQIQISKDLQTASQNKVNCQQTVICRKSLRFITIIH